MKQSNDTMTLMNIPVTDPFPVTEDPDMPRLAAALEPRQAQKWLVRNMTCLLREQDQLTLDAIRVTRYKPKRRCVIEYDIRVDRPGQSSEWIILIGKVRAQRYGNASYRLMDAFWNAGFTSGSQDGISIPEPVGMIPKFRMWVQRKVPGHVFTDLLTKPESVEQAKRIAEAAHKVHHSGVPTERIHSMADELRILHERLPLVAHETPAWGGRIEKLLERCDRLGATLPKPLPRGIHRDFYPDQVLIDDDHLYLIDFDLYCMGDPALDIGNFIGHLTEHSLRILGHTAALKEVEGAMEERFVELSGEHTRPAIHGYATLTLVRLIYLSTLFPDRRPFTEPLLTLCEERLSAYPQMSAKVGRKRRP